VLTEEKHLAMMLKTSIAVVSEGSNKSVPRTDKNLHKIEKKWETKFYGRLSDTLQSTILRIRIK